LNSFVSVYNEDISVFISIAGIILITVLAYQGSIKLRLLVAMSQVAFSTLAEVIVGLIFLVFNIDSGSDEFFGSVISKIIILLGVKALKSYYTVKDKKGYTAQYWYLLISIIVISILLVQNIYWLSLEAPEVYVISSLVFILLLDYLIFRAADIFSEFGNIRQKNMALQQQLISYEREQTNIQVSEKIAKELHHDMKNHLISIREIAFSGGTAKVKDYVNDLLEGLSDAERGRIARSGNIIVDGLINSKGAIFRDNDIDIRLVLEIPDKLPFTDVDVSIILGNTLDNAIEAAKKSADANKYIEITMWYRQKNLLMQVENSFNGVVLKNINKEFITTKDDNANHGMGISIIKTVAEKYNGLAEFKYERNVFTTRVLLYSI